jgi:hypothetical protein
MTMKREHVRALQTKLAAMGLYDGEICGERGPKTDAAATKGAPRLAPVPDDFASWSDKRRTVGCLQAYATSEDCDPGAIDGWWGPSTEEGVRQLMRKLEGQAGWDWADVIPGHANPNGFPLESGVEAFYGPHGIPGGREPPLERVPSPWDMKISWNLAQKRTSFRVHTKAAASLKRVLEKIDAAYTDAQKSEIGIDIFGGDYVPRRIRNGRRWSMHAWGIAFDFDPERNGMDMGHHNSRLAQRDAVPFWEAWESEGWYSLGRQRGFDYMHVQAARRD